MAYFKIESILKDKVARLSVQYFVKSINQNETVPFETLFHNWVQSSNELQNSMTSLFESLDIDLSGSFRILKKYSLSSETQLSKFGYILDFFEKSRFFL